MSVTGKWRLAAATRGVGGGVGSSDARKRETGERIMFTFYVPLVFSKNIYRVIGV
jgi:hypothetical protein